MKVRSICKSLGLPAVVLAAGIFGEPRADASVIDTITLPAVFTSYDSGTGVFKITGQPNGDADITYNDGRTPNPEVLTDTSFLFNTLSMTSTISGSGLSISYDSSVSMGDIKFLDDSFTSLLEANLHSLDMTIVDPALGLLEGTGLFEITGGTRAADFGLNGGFATIGISFMLPTSFNSSFAGFSTMWLSPVSGVANVVPLPAAVWPGAAALLCLFGVSRKKLRA